jgi:hypothetical protein
MNELAWQPAGNKSTSIELCWCIGPYTRPRQAMRQASSKVCMRPWAKTKTHKHSVGALSYVQGQADSECRHAAIDGLRQRPKTTQTYSAGGVCYVQSEGRQ